MESTNKINGERELNADFKFVPTFCKSHTKG